jgi:hypothetical protein
VGTSGGILEDSASSTSLLDLSCEAKAALITFGGGSEIQRGHLPRDDYPAPIDLTSPHVRAAGAAQLDLIESYIPSGPAMCNRCVSAVMFPLCDCRQKLVMECRGQPTRGHVDEGRKRLLSRVSF